MEGLFFRSAPLSSSSAEEHPARFDRFTSRSSSVEQQVSLPRLTRKLKLGGVSPPISSSGPFCKLWRSDVDKSHANFAALRSVVTSSITSLFQSRFYLNDLQICLAFLPNGAGSVARSYLTGYLMDHDYRVIESQYRTSRNIPEDTKSNKKDLVDFSIENLG